MGLFGSVFDGAIINKDINFPAQSTNAGSTPILVSDGRACLPPLRVFNGVTLDPRLPVPDEGFGCTPTIHDNANLNISNSQLNGYVAELNLANEVAALPNQTVLKYGDVIGRNGSDVISVNVLTGEVILWDSKFRSSPKTIPESTTFTSPTASEAALEEALDVIRSSNLNSGTKLKAVQNVLEQNITTITAGAGEVRNSIVSRLCGGYPC